MEETHVKMKKGRKEGEGRNEGEGRKEGWKVGRMVKKGWKKRMSK